MNIESIIKDIIATQLTIDLNEFELSLDTNLQNIGMNSITFIKIIVEIEGEFDIEYPDDKLLITESGTLKQMLSVVEGCLNNG